MIELRIGDRFIDLQGKWCEVLSTYSSDKFFPYLVVYGMTERLLNLHKACFEKNKIPITNVFKYSRQTIDKQYRRGVLKLIPKKVKNWREEIKC